MDISPFILIFALALIILYLVVINQKQYKNIQIKDIEIHTYRKTIKIMLESMNEWATECDIQVNRANTAEAKLKVINPDKEFIDGK